MASDRRDLGCSFFLLLATCIALVGFTLPTIHCSSFPPLAYTSYEVVFPSQLAPLGEKAKKEELSYIIKAAGRDYIIRLKRQKHILAINFPVFTYNSRGERIESHPYTPTDCYHQGYVEGIVDSLAVLRTCSGLSGLLRIDDKTYSIEPSPNSSTFQHFLYLSGEPQPIPSLHRKRVEGAKRQRKNYEIDQRDALDDSPPYQTYLRYIELYIVVDRNTFAQEADNIHRVEMVILSAINIMDAIFHSLKTHIILVGLEIWTVKNFINISEDVRQVLWDFNDWQKEKRSDRIKYDTAFLVFHQPSGANFGESYKSSICTQRLSAGVQSYIQDMVLFTRGFAHKLAHHIGLKHDGPNCFCGRYTNCILHAYQNLVSQFSNCSLQDMKNLDKRSKLNCLANIPKSWSSLSFCGNGILDPGEKCDCGGPDNCKQATCCTTDCHFKRHAVCDGGECCDRCQFLTQGKICRNKTNECDLPEYCNGASAQCPTDLYVQDGTPCNRLSSYCYEKKCLTHDDLCNQVFKGVARAAPKMCYTSLNAKGDLFGNCGRNATGFLKCQLQDSLCGRLQCVDVHVPPVLKGFSVFKASVAGNQCWSIASPGKKLHPDLGAVPNGLACDRERLCINHSCLPATVLKTLCRWQLTCARRGVCNNLHKCHCDLGWNPPNCMTWGVGGSIDGGFPLNDWNIYLIKLLIETVIPLGVLAIAILTALFTKLCEMGKSLQKQRKDIQKTQEKGSSPPPHLRAFSTASHRSLGRNGLQNPSFQQTILLQASQQGF